MKIKNITVYSWAELLRRLQAVCLMGSDYRPYTTATISLTSIDTHLVSPCQRYVLLAELLKVRDLRWAVAEHGIDILAMTSELGEVSPIVTVATPDAQTKPAFLVVELDDGARHTVLPPVIEVSLEANGKRHNLINDGMHRLYLARQSAIIPHVILIKNASKPYYAYPLADGWGDVEIIDKIGKNYLKKFHRIANYKSLYRDFSSTFEGVGGPRGHSQ